ncbi:membrane protein FxsA [Nitratireductor sp. L1-7-SE]|uniref:Membrane protein FxsA n=1 Tax=Nitratireductor rhodophyticola TaxID=2854036 RepID=A0ABS7R6C5_9HYPH|nr:FxsA family protein [Nitratireductor rhodophyticola]MBY8916482.1 membrane protein FxsA [Nitratireductor rhodophyticola]MBY8921846.1 membrane protein FxsA [Nitratireductor rhodophyticola]
MRFSIVPFLLLAIPLAEIAMFVVVGSQIGVFPTLGLVLVTAIAGSILLRIQGFGVVRRIQETMNEGGVPGRDLVHGMMIMVAGVLLLTPGFITDTLGFLLFVPAIRDAGWKFLRSRIVILGGPASAGGRHANPHGRDTGPQTIDLSADDYSESGDENSPWRKPDRE